MAKYCKYESDVIKIIGLDDGLYGIKDPFEPNTNGKYGKHWSEPF